MDYIEILSLVGGLMTSGAPVAQAFKTFRSRDVAGLSVGTYLLLLFLVAFGILIGVQYSIVTMILLNSIGLIANMLILYLISKRALAGFVLTWVLFWLLGSLIAPLFISKLLTTAWAEQVAFIYGIIAATTFLPQVLLTHRTRNASALSLYTLILFCVGMVLWIIISVLVNNYSLIFWNVILFLMLLELLRLKLTLPDKKDSAVSSDAPTTAPLV